MCEGVIFALDEVSFNLRVLKVSNFHFTLRVRALLHLAAQGTCSSGRERVFECAQLLQVVCACGTSRKPLHTGCEGEKKP